MESHFNNSMSRDVLLVFFLLSPLIGCRSQYPLTFTDCITNLLAVPGSPVSETSLRPSLFISPVSLLIFSKRSFLLKDMVVEKTKVY